MVEVIEVQPVPVSITRNALGAYVDASALTGDAAAQAAKGANIVTGGTAALGNPEAPTYDSDGPGRVFVEGLRVTRPVTRYVTQIVPVTEIRRVPETVKKTVPREVVKRVPVQVTRMVPTTVTRTVPVTTCRLVTEEVCKMVPTPVTTLRAEVVTRCIPETVTRQVPCTVTATVPKTVGECGPSARSGCCPPAPAVGPTCSNSCCTPGCPVGIGGKLRSYFDDPCRPRPIKDFFGRLCANRLACDPCPPAPCCSPGK
jgi:hypothetical protein